MKTNFRRLHFVTVKSDNYYAYGLAHEQELLIVLNSGSGEFVINYSTFVDERFIKDPEYLRELLKTCIRHWLFNNDFLKQCFAGPEWVNPDLKNLELLKKVDSFFWSRKEH